MARSVMSSMFPTGVGTTYNIAIVLEFNKLRLERRNGAKVRFLFQTDEKTEGKMIVGKKKAFFLLPFAFLFVPLHAE